MRKLGIISKISKENIKTQTFSSNQNNNAEREQEIVAVKTDITTPSANGNVITNFLAETRWLTRTLKATPEITQEILRVLSIIK